MQTYDVLIIGGGPAATSAAMTLKNRNKTMAVVANKAETGNLYKAEKITNYPGLPPMSGAEMAELFRRQLIDTGADIIEGRALSAMSMGDTFGVSVGSQFYMARCLIITAGTTRERLYPGDGEFLGRGVSYCATCDGMFYRGKTIAVFCGAKRYEPEVTYLAEMAAKVYLYAGYPGCEVEAPNVEQLKSPIRQVQGGMRLTGITLADGTEVPVDGLFCLRSAIAPTTLLPGLTLEGPHIVVDRHMATNLPGCFAAGDCTGAPYQIAKAVGEGNIAAHSILDYLAEQGREA